MLEGTCPSASPARAPQGLRPDGGAAPGPGRSPPTTGLCPGPPGVRPRCRLQPPYGSWEETVPEDLGSAEGPPGCQVLAVKQHTGLRSHEEEVLACLPWHVRQVAESSRAAGTGADSGMAGRLAPCSPCRLPMAALPPHPAARGDEVHPAPRDGPRTFHTDQPAPKRPMGGGVEHALPQQVSAQGARSPGRRLMQALHRAAAQGACCPKRRGLRTRLPGLLPGLRVPPTHLPCGACGPPLSLRHKHPPWAPRLPPLCALGHVASTRGTVLQAEAQRTAREEDVVSACPGDVQEGASGPAHAKAAAVADLASSAAGVEVTADLQHARWCRTSQFEKRP